MSRSNNTDIKNPAKKFYEWQGSKGSFKYFDKELGEKGEQVELSLPVRFLVLDTLSTVKGFDKQANSSYWSNEVRNTKNETMEIRNKDGVCATGLYRDIIGHRNCVGAKYCQSVYAAIKEGDKMILVNFQLIGSANTAWIEFRKKHDVFEGAIEIASFKEEKNGSTVYQVPVFKMIKTTPESDKAAISLDIELQQYLKLYFQRNAHQEANSIIEKEEVFDERFKDETDFQNVPGRYDEQPPFDDNEPF